MKESYSGLTRSVSGQGAWFGDRNGLAGISKALSFISSVTGITPKHFKQIAVPAEGLFCVSILWGPVKIRQ